MHNTSTTADNNVRYYADDDDDDDDEDDDGVVVVLHPLDDACNQANALFTHSWTRRAQCGAATCSTSLVRCFLSVPQAAASKPQRFAGMWNSQKTLVKTSGTSCRPRLYVVKLLFVSFVSGRAALFSSPPLLSLVDDQQDSSEDTGDTIWLSHRVSESGEREK